jgi:predicted DCC family thiol-disulfide oxidoreductase YuxK
MSRSIAAVEPGSNGRPAEKSPGTPPTHPIIFFDGECGLCHRFVNFVCKADKKAVFRFAPLQGETAKAILPPGPTDPGQWSIVYLDEHGLYRRSDAALEVCRRLGGWWKLWYLFVLVPRPLRDALYRLIAHNRYRWFGKREVCRLPTPGERERFLP